MPNLETIHNEKAASREPRRPGRIHYILAGAAFGFCALVGAFLFIAFVWGASDKGKPVTAPGRTVVGIETAGGYDLIVAKQLGDSVSRKRDPSSILPADLKVSAVEYPSGQEVDACRIHGSAKQIYNDISYLRVYHLDFPRAGKFQIVIAGSFTEETTFYVQPSPRDRIWMVVAAACANVIGVFGPLSWVVIVFIKRNFPPKNQASAKDL